jgi:DNA mismatch repair protein MutS
VSNCSVQVLEKEGEVTFLHKIAPGGSDRSYGIQVARLAGLPEELVEVAQSYVEQQSCQDISLQAAHMEAAADREKPDPKLLQLVQAFRELDLDELSPRQAWAALDKLKRIAAKVVSRIED